MNEAIACELCAGPGGRLLRDDGRCRVVRVADPGGEGFPGYCRVVWNRHVAEMSELDDADADHLMAVVVATERAVRSVVAPDKINLASLGNVVPHLHWHVIPRWRDDSRFPAPIWVAAKRTGTVPVPPADDDLRRALELELSRLSRPT